MKNNNVRPIAFYLPQFYPTPENDEWWEPGFTEWTNVAKAKPLFKGHNQPRVPQELSFYDLRVPETREKQVKLAREAGIEGFCYWHYWFAGRRLLDDVFREVVESGMPDFPFCLCWANHSWSAKTWNPNTPDKLLIAQTYPGEDDFVNHFNAMLPAFKDKRYMKYEGKLIFGIFDPIFFENFALFKKTWNRLAKENGLEGFYFYVLCQEEANLSRFNEQEYDAVVYDALQDSYKDYLRSTIKHKYHNFLVNHLKKPYVKKYEDYVKDAISLFKSHPKYIPCIDPDFDHSPRSAHRWIILHDSNPKLWGKLCSETKKIIEERNDNTLLFIKAWNEWGEGNYMEPDSKWGKQYIEEARKVFN